MSMLFLRLIQPQSDLEQSIAPNFIVLRMALGTAVSSPSKATLPFLTTSVHRRTNIAFAANPESGFTDMSRTATNPSAIRSYKGNTTTALDVTDEEVYPMVTAFIYS